tara:strand:- start:928 stop:1320 length:393 start_codon:yes stop_codon:yes gene_type:complete
MEMIMNIQTITVPFGATSVDINVKRTTTGLTGQNMNPDNNRKFNRVAKKFNKQTGLKLSRVSMYKASRVGARKVKAEFGSRIVCNSKATMELLLTGVDKTLDRKNHNLDLGEFNVTDILDLACKYKRKQA